MTTISRSRTVYVAAAAATVFVGFAVWILSGWSHGTARQAIDDITFCVVALTAAGCAAVAASSASGRVRAAWTALAVGVLGWAIGDAMWIYYELVLHRDPFPSLADVAYLLLPVGACAAMLLFPTNRNGQYQVRLFLDGVIVAASLFLVAWFTVLQPTYEAGAESLSGLVISLAYPTSDLVVLTIAAYVLVRAGSTQRLPITLLSVGMVCIALSDSAFVYLAVKDHYFSGNFIDIGWMMGLLLILVAAVAGRDRAAGEPGSVELPSWASVWLPYAPLMLAGIVAVAQPVPILRSAPIQVGAALMVVTVLARQFLAVIENRQLVKKVAVQALQDPLTGLANRALFQDRLHHALQLCQHRDTTVGVMILDLDDFKLINDTLGHPAGDELLKRVGERISDSVKRGDAVARLGGDEFGVMVAGTSHQANLIARQLLAAFDEPITVDGHELLIRTSIGLAVASAESVGASADDLLKQADIAMYSAKRSSATDVRTFHSSMLLGDAVDTEVLNRPGGGAEGVQLLGELWRALDHGELTLVYQPKFDMKTTRTVGVEALLRWNHPGRGLISPDQFLPLVRHHQLMDAVTDFVINRALDDAQKWCRAGLIVPVAINLSATSVAMPDLPERFSSALSQRGLATSMLDVEITEDLFLEDTERARQVLARLRERGIRVSIDDFGSGYSALWYLRDLPVDEVKLDRRFIAPIVSDPRAAAVVRAVIDLAHVLLLTVVAEGVEDSQTADLLRSYGCDVVQGFYYSPPVPADEIIGMAANSVTPAPEPASAKSN
ncbi:MAG: putative bifunctional diguanylate cyclase/phosphodiesterase [Candidatus Nanopelagicales bacterium]